MSEKKILAYKSGSTYYVGRFQAWMEPNWGKRQVGLVVNGTGLTLYFVTGLLRMYWGRA